MRSDRTEDFRDTKRVAKRHYHVRQMDKYIKWTFEVKGYLKWKDLVSQQELNNIRPYE